MFAQAGRDLSPSHVQALSRGMSQGTAPVMLDAYNQALAAQRSAIDSLYGAGGQTAGLFPGSISGAGKPAGGYRGVERRGAGAKLRAERAASPRSAEARPADEPAGPACEHRHADRRPGKSIERTVHHHELAPVRWNSSSDIRTPQRTCCRSCRGWAAVAAATRTARGVAEAPASGRRRRRASIATIHSPLL